MKRYGVAINGSSVQGAVELTEGPYVLYTDAKALEESRDRWMRYAKVLASRPVGDWDPAEVFDAWDRDLTSAEAALTLAGEEV